MEEITQHIKRRRWQLIGHVLRRNANEHPRVVTWIPEGRLRRGRPRETLGRTVERVLVLRTDRLDERERKALYSL